MKTIEITRASLEALIADEAKWYAKATELEAANARLRDENGGLRQARDTYRTHVETANADAHMARNAIRALISGIKDDAKRRKAGVSETLDDAVKRAVMLINEQESTPF
jgi:predicted  nucleic acid-binding Zn-ribbon protein